MADLFSMKNRVVLLTGASRGLGRDMALALRAPAPPCSAPAER